MEGYEGQVIRVGSRRSELALIQTNFVIDCLQKVYPELKFEIVTMTTLGDRILNVSLPKIGEKSLFTKDLEDALHCGSVDFVVHSLKDLPTTLPDGLAIGAVFEREDPRDALVLRDDLKCHTLESLPPRSCIGTSSLRRTAQLRSLHPHLCIVDVRGNLNTRLRKLQQYSSNTDKPSNTESQNSIEVEGTVSAGSENSGNLEGSGNGNTDETGDKTKAQEYAALILAQSGLVRMGWQDKISQVLPCSKMMYAVGQGALAVECRSDNQHILQILAPFNHAESYCRVLAERSFLKTLGGGCSAPVGVSTSLKPHENKHRLTISGAVWSLDGTTKVNDRVELVFPQVRKSDKHKLSPTTESEHKKVKIDPAVNPIEEYNLRISEMQGNVNLNCEDTRSEEEIRSLANQSGRNLNSELSNAVNDSDNGNARKVDSVTLYCGLTENVNVLTYVIEKCEGLGKELANNLIGKGALEVMKVSQDYIRSSVKKS